MATMEDRLNKLESKVLEAIETIQGLRRENSDLKSRCEELENSLQGLSEDKEQLQRQLNTASETAAQAELFEEKRQVIETRVSGLLEKLEAMS